MQCPQYVLKCNKIVSLTRLSVFHMSFRRFSGDLSAVWAGSARGCFHGSLSAHRSHAYENSRILCGLSGGMLFSNFVCIMLSNFNVRFACV